MRTISFLWLERIKSEGFEVKKKSLVITSFLFFYYLILSGQPKPDLFGSVNIQFETSPSINEFNYNVLTNPIIQTHASIVGLGEGTHGTSDFTQVKSHIVKQLVGQHGFKNFLLEAGYVECLQIDAYINNADIDIDSVLMRLVSWPWGSQEFKDLLVWMRTYNASVTVDNKIHFYGIDVCINATLNKNSPVYYGNVSNLPTISKALEIYNDAQLSSKRKQRKLSQLQKDCDKRYNQHGGEYLQCTNIIQSAKSKLYNGGKSTGYRENELFEMVKRIKNSKPDTEKFILWAHNEHVTQRSNSRKSLGHFLNKEYKNKYQTIGFDFVKGSFCAVDIDSLYQGKKKFGVIFYREAPEKTVAHQLESINEGVLFIDLTIQKNKKALCSKKRYIQSIGATYGNIIAQKKPNLFLQKIKLCKSFNYMFIIKATTASQLLVKQKR